ncbi:MAG: hypothetical protein F6K50_11440 [Moorea sp. SIO3I7]|uniref:hypothetical protein n=1 Tax=unclassified Moorena TaxID=2683338 RepID=UPI0013BF0D1A|nr:MULTISPECIES: hypothetical protein [unclassified Moorena]NEN96120.1 hypothetical protein [Moorena sp. SIO3I7]NEO05815.1 hypothetical protein [Moorena sp. SIO3I8]NEO20234.1 hypothetical protein [Moorena sp. SIO4A5]NEP22683.1 hypothetical protein [Moorena sp. SIO3I6]NEQ56326.1 hypothetical protein [Moorena sp. SIO4A1]
MAASPLNATNFPSLTPCVITENSRTVLPSPSFLAPRSGSGDFSSAMLLWSRYAIDLDQKATLGLWPRCLRCEWSRYAMKRSFR